MMRNVGVFAHVDHGKTTLVERMLVYSRSIAAPGEVHDGNTIMDYLPQEMARGITINAAATTLPWRDSEINLIDTPGHVDFTAEVERSARVLDGAILVVDAVAGVQAQTANVWAQTERYDIPTLVFVNKMDREGADYLSALDSLRSRLSASTHFVPVSLPVLDSSHDRAFAGVTDIVDMVSLSFGGEYGESVAVSDIPEGGKQWEAMLDARRELIDTLMDVDDVFVEHLLTAQEEESPEGAFEDNPTVVSPAALKSALARATSARKIVPVLPGSAFKNMGVQPVMDAVVDYLPSPGDVPPISARTLRDRKGSKAGSLVSREPRTDEPLTALAFKVSHLGPRGAVVYLRVYSGVLKPSSTLFNGTKGAKERISKLYKVYADDMEEVSSLGPGSIGAALGLKVAATGDTLTLGSDKGNHVVLDGVHIPPPVFFSAVEPESLSVQADMEKALAQLTREDPSLAVHVDAETGETILSGMGELHLEYIGTRLKDELKIPCTITQPRVAYKETLTSPRQIEYAFRAPAGGGGALDGGIAHELRVGLEVTPSPSGSQTSVDVHEDATDHLSREQEDAVHAGLALALQRGVIGSLPLTGVHIRLVDIDAEGGSDIGSIPPPILSVGISKAMYELLLQASDDVTIMEPLMDVELDVGEDHVGTVVSDLSSPTRRGLVTGVEPLSPSVQRIWATVPLASLSGYSTALRSMTKGNGSFTMAFRDYGPLPQTDWDNALL